MRPDDEQANVVNVHTVALKAYARIADVWSLSFMEAACLAGLSQSTWERVRQSDYRHNLTRDQLLRISALIGIYKLLGIYFSDPLSKNWLTRPNAGPLFNNRRPIDTALDRGLPQILAIRDYLDALCQGA